MFILIMLQIICIDESGSNESDSEECDVRKHLVDNAKLEFPDVYLKYKMLISTKKKSVLVNVFPRILLFICDIHWEHSWTKWTSKVDQVASIYADDIKCRLCRIAHIVNEEKLRIALAAFCNCKRYTGRLKN